MSLNQATLLNVGLHNVHVTSIMIITMHPFGFKKMSTIREMEERWGKVVEIIYSDTDP